MAVNKNLLDEGNENGVGSQFSRSCHCARLHTVLFFCSQQDAVMLSHKDVDKYHPPINIWLKERRVLC